MKDRNVIAIILAAGESSRMGQSKQLLPVQGEPLLLKTVNTAIHSIVKNTIVVLGAHEKEHRSVISHLPIQIIYNDQWNKGMGSSIKAGLKQAAKINSEAIIILVCDQPLLSTDHINNLIAKHDQTKKPIVVSAYDGVQGVPAFFHKSYFSSLAALNDKEGAKKIITQNAADIEIVPFPGGSIDLDTMENYKEFIKNQD